MTKTINIPGRKVPQGNFSAFVPTPLPPKLDFTPRLIRIGSCGGIGGIAGLPTDNVLVAT